VPETESLAGRQDKPLRVLFMVTRSF
jgi:hypothetical protein